MLKLHQQGEEVAAEPEHKRPRQSTSGTDAFGWFVVVAFFSWYTGVKVGVSNTNRKPPSAIRTARLFRYRETSRR